MNPGSPGAGRQPGEPPGGWRALAVWGLGVAVYFTAVTYRTSLGVAGIDAAERFDVGASALSTFSILQLLVYAGMQIPVGVLVDRWGTKRVLVAGVVLFTVGQFGFALAHGYPQALVSRALLGCGDAMTFISVLRLGGQWFPARRGPLIAQVAALFGMAGNLVPTLVLTRTLTAFGWTPTFAGSAVGGVVLLVLVLLFLRDEPQEVRAAREAAATRAGPEPGGTATPRPTPGRRPESAVVTGRRPALTRRLAGGRQRSGRRPTGYVRSQISAAWREPGTRLGMWVHFTTQFPGMVFLLLWGMPFLVADQRLSRSDAGTLLTVVVLDNMAIGLVYGQVIARHHAARAPIALGTVAANTLAWAAVLLWPGPAPGALLVVLCLALGACGPASLIGFDFARPANPPERQGTASGIVNVGGFTASMITLLLVGVLLDLTGDSYRTAFSVIFVLQALGVSQILRLRGQAHRRERERLVASRVEAVHVPA